MKTQSLTARDIAERVDGTIIGDPATAVRGVAALDDATPDHLSFLGNPKYRQLAAASQAGILLVPEGFETDPGEGRAVVRCADPSDAFSRFVVEFAPPAVVRAPGVHPSAVVAESAECGDGVHIGPQAVVDEGAVIGGGAIIEACAYIGCGVTIGRDSRIYPNVTILDRCVIGERVIIHSGSVIGADGFGYINTPEGHHKVPQLGIVQIDDDVELGACVTVDRARFGRTWIQRGAKVDNLVMVAHNVVVGEHAILVGQCGIAGSARIGRFAVLAGQAGVPGHLKVGDGATVMSKSAPMRDVPAGEMEMGTPSMPRSEFFRQFALLKRLPALVKRIAELEKALQQS